jgi:hypothetical protein
MMIKMMAEGIMVAEIRAAEIMGAEIMVEGAMGVEEIIMVVETMLPRIMLCRVRRSQWKGQLPRRPGLEVY